MLLLATLSTGCGTSPGATTEASGAVDVSPSRESPSSAAASLPSSDLAVAASPPVVPAAAQCYVDAVNAANLDALVGCFAPDGLVIDVSRRINGADAIRRWADNEVIGGRLEVLDVAEQRDGHIRLLVHWAPAGSDGWRAYYTFDHADGRIRQVDLQYA